MRRDIVVAGCLLAVLLIGGCSRGTEPNTGGVPTPAPTTAVSSPQPSPSAAQESTTPAPKPKPTPTPSSTDIPYDEIALLSSTLTGKISKCPEDAVEEAYDLCREEMDIRLESVNLINDGLALLPARPVYRKLHQRIEEFRDRYKPLTAKRCFSRNPAASHATCHKYADRIRSAHASIRTEVERLAGN